MLACAEISASLDKRMQNVRDVISKCEDKAELGETGKNNEEYQLLKRLVERQRKDIFGMKE